MQSKEQIAQDLYHLLGNGNYSTFDFLEVINKHSLEQYDVAGIANLIFKLSEQLSKMVLEEINN